MARPMVFCSERDSECFSSLYDIENFLRVIVRWELRGAFHAQWRGAISQDVLELAKERQSQEKSIVYVDTVEADTFAYLNLSELKDVLVGPLWEKAFKPWWPPLDIVQSEFKKILAVRNKIAHFRPSTSRDLRVIDRFRVDLMDWTRHYEMVRGYATQLTDDGQTKEFFWKKGLQKVVSEWDDRLRSAAGSIRLSLVGNHLMATGSAESGSIDPEMAKSMLRTLDNLLSFCRVGDQGESMCIYVPCLSDESKMIDGLRSFADLMTKTVALLSSDEVKEKYGFWERGGILPWSVPLPFRFFG